MTAATPPSRPVAGVICCTRAIDSESSQTVMGRYVRAIADHAHASVLLVPTLRGAANLADVADRLDGLFLTGSPSNIEAWRYGEMVDSHAGPADPDRDAAMIALIQAMVVRSKPVFGVCRGLQELNVAFGGTLRRDMSTSPDLMAHHAPDDASLDEIFSHRHHVRLTDGGVLQRALGASTLVVNSVHYQGVERLAPGLSAEAHAFDGVVEAVSGLMGNAELLAVQWHPEWRTDEDAASRTFFRLFGDALRRASRLADGSAKRLT